MPPSARGFLYDDIGSTYRRTRRADPRIAAAVRAALGDAASLVNVGAGTGAYEPADRTVLAIEPSAAMLGQRAPGAAPAVCARAEALPLADRSVDAALAILTIHHWTDQAAGLRECARVARDRVVALTWDPAAEGFWLVQDYLPGFLALDRAQFPSMAAIAAAFDASARVEITPAPVPHDCVDGFLGAYWRRPEAYLDPRTRAGMSSFARESPAEAPATSAGLARLAADLTSGVWDERHGALRRLETLDAGYRIVVVRLRG